MSVGWFLERLAHAGDAPALVEATGAVGTYAALVAGVARMTARLRGAELPPGASVAISGTFGTDAVALLLAVVAERRVAVPLGPGSPAQHDALIRRIGAGLHVAFASGGQDWQVCPEPQVPGLVAASARGGFVLFTSGTSGRPKAALYGVDALVDRYRRARTPVRRLCVFRFDHVGGLSMLLRTLSSGGALVAVEDPGDPHEVWRAVCRHGVDVVVASPTFLRLLLLSGAPRPHDATALSQIHWSSEPMPSPLLAALQAAFPRVVFAQSYGLTELGVLKTRPKPADPTWFRFDDPVVEHRVVDGRLWLRSARAMVGYVDAPSPFDREGWYDTGDLVQTDGVYLRVEGRATDVINVGGQKVLPQVVESALLSLPNITGAHVRGRPNAVTGQVVSATVTLAEPEDLRAVRQRVRHALRGRLEPAEVPVVVEVASSLDPTRRLKLPRARSEEL